MLNSCNNYFGEYDEVGAINKTEQISDFLDVPLFVSLFSENQMNLFILSRLRKGTYIHFIGNGERFLKGFYLKLSRSKHISKKKFQLFPTPIVFAPDEVFDTYVEITDDLYLDAPHFKLLIQKANSYI